MTGCEIDVLARLQAAALDIVTEETLLTSQRKVAANHECVVEIRLSTGIGEVAAAGRVRRSVGLRIILQRGSRDGIDRS